MGAEVWSGSKPRLLNKLNYVPVPCTTREFSDASRKPATAGMNG